MDEDVWLEDRMFPWLADGSMGDETIDQPFWDESGDEEYCSRCLEVVLPEDDGVCQECGHEHGRA